MVAGAKRGKGNAKSYTPLGTGYSSNSGYFSSISQEEIVEKTVDYMLRHPEFVQELEIRIAEDEHPELVERDISYLMRKGISGPKNINDYDLDYVTKEIADKLFFNGKEKRNFMERTAEGSLKLLLKNYLSDTI
jgi:hypothetical protein